MPEINIKEYEKRCQDPVRFKKCFDELERIARKALNKIKVIQNL